MKDRDYVRLASGREFYANHGIIGLSPDLEPSSGYDQMIATNPEFEPDLSASESVELADMMIERWKQFRAKFAVL